MKTGRHSMILDIIERFDIETQEEIAEELKKNGFDVTQATVSRDIKELRLIKVLSDNGIYKYATIDKAGSGTNDRFFRIFTESVVSMDYANNLIVIKTIDGSAQAAAAAIDALKWSDIIGCIAGDDTILVVIRNNDAVNHVMRQFKDMMK